MTREYLLGVIRDLPREVFTHFSKRSSGPHSDRGGARIKKLFDYTLNGGKCARSQLAFNTYRTLASNASSDQILNAAKVATSVEVLQNFFLVMDDIVDHSRLRRGKPCWHTLPDVGLRAINDGLLLESSVDIILRNALRQHPQKEAILDNLAETKAKTVWGQDLDIATTKIAEFNWQLYKELVEHKTSHYTYYFPLSLGFQLADVSVNLASLQEIAYKLGYLFQAQDDYLDVFGNVAVMGKSSNDFAESKCTWVICALLDKISSNPTKMRLFSSYFGSDKPEDIDAIRTLITQEGILDDFQEFQASSVAELHGEIAKFPIEKIRILLNDSVEAIVNRQK